MRVDTSFDIVILGGGPGGYVAAVRAAQLKMKVALVEAEHLGGICLNWGCIPTKALLKSAEISHLLHHRLGEYGFEVSDIKHDFQGIIARSRAVSKRLSAGIAYLMNKNKVTLFEGRGTLKGPGKLEVTLNKNGEKKLLTSKHIILATGAHARALPHIKPDGKLIWTYKKAMTPDIEPKSLLVIGSGAIGVEFASFYNAMGTKVTILEKMDRILPVEDHEISKAALKAFKSQGIEIHTEADITKCEPQSNYVDVSYQLKDGKSHAVQFDRVILATGVAANIDNIGLESTKITLDHGHIITNQWLETNEPGIYAIGDVTMPPLLAHKASHEGIICIEKIASLPHAHPLDRSNIPGCTYAHPQIASVGLTEEAAKAAGHRDLKIGRFPFSANGKAIALGEEIGMIKTIFDAKSGKMLGAHMIGAEVTELIQGFVIAKKLETTEIELMQTVFPHPTLSEMMHESVLDAYDAAIHI